MGQIGPLQIVLVLLLVVLLFGRGKISSLMGDVAKGIKSFKKGMRDDEDDETAKVERSSDAIDVSSKSKEDT